MCLKGKKCGQMKESAVSKITETGSTPRLTVWWNTKSSATITYNPPLNLKLIVNECFEWASFSWMASVSSLCDFSKQHLMEEAPSWFDCIYLLFGTCNILFFKMCLVKSTKAYWHPKIINFAVLNFSECRSKEVMRCICLTFSVDFLFASCHELESRILNYASLITKPSNTLQYRED